ncbi:hypothetical protein B0H63DRAFT_455143 [Podospora didyma]|uniref:Uncharacterized protein n=1 Tax=Podospora didyma TaxID=330526 RepID=A0AAE0K1J5_9PEZI|nr:hypothetical protein B0H63DRAFT_455143 [Podospora didyma]
MSRLPMHPLLVSTVEDIQNFGSMLPQLRTISNGNLPLDLKPQSAAPSDGNNSPDGDVTVTQEAVFSPATPTAPSITAPAPDAKMGSAAPVKGDSDSKIIEYLATLRNDIGPEAVNAAIAFLSEIKNYQDSSWFTPQRRMKLTKTWTDINTEVYKNQKVAGSLPFDEQRNFIDAINDLWFFAHCAKFPSLDDDLFSDLHSTHKSTIRAVFDDHQLSPTEKTRIFRAFYRLERVSRLIAALRYPHAQLTPWEVEELVSAYQHVHNQYRLVFEQVNRDFLDRLAELTHPAQPRGYNQLQQRGLMAGFLCLARSDDLLDLKMIVWWHRTTAAGAKSSAAFLIRCSLSSARKTAATFRMEKFLSQPAQFETHNLDIEYYHSTGVAFWDQERFESILESGALANGAVVTPGSGGGGSLILLERPVQGRGWLRAAANSIERENSGVFKYTLEPRPETMVDLPAPLKVLDGEGFKFTKEVEV